MSKKYVFPVLIMISILALSLSPAAEESEKRVVINVLAYGISTNNEGRDWIRMVESFEKEHTDIDIRYNLFTYDSYRHRVDSLLALGGEAVPDMAFIGSGFYGGDAWKNAGQLFDHRPYLDMDYYDLDLIPAMGENGEIWSVPLGTSIITSVLYMNKELVNSLGFSAPATYQDLVDMVPKARAAGLQVVSINGIDGWTWGACLLSCIVARMSGDAHWISKAVAGRRKFTDKVFTDSLAVISRMVRDGVIAKESLCVDYGSNINNYTVGKALFMVQGIWAAGHFEDEIADKTLILAWPEFPGEKAKMSGSVAAAISAGYGLSKKGADNPVVREAGIKFLKHFNSHDAVTQRIRDNMVYAPVLKNYRIPEDLSPLKKQRIRFCWSVTNTEVIDMFLTGEPNDYLNLGIQRIVDGEATPSQVAAEVEKALRN
jgi:raffinose/stachyose/melibiose transport system substrate-binding protein